MEIKGEVGVLCFRVEKIVWNSCFREAKITVYRNIMGFLGIIKGLVKVGDYELRLFWI